MFIKPPPTVQNPERVTLRSVIPSWTITFLQRQAPLLRRWANQSTFNQMIHFEMIKAILATANLEYIVASPLGFHWLLTPPLLTEMMRI